MSVGFVPQTPAYFTLAGFRRLTVPEYHKLIEIGILAEDDRVELLEGHMVMKMPPNPPHSNVITNTTEALVHRLPNGWRLRCEQPITLSDSEPEPDFVLARGDRATFSARHPEAKEIGLVVEVADSSLVVDRADMSRIYARADIPIYWIINVVDRQIEVYTHARPNDPTPAYGSRTDYKLGASIPFVLDGQTIALIAVDEFLG